MTLSLAEIFPAGNDYAENTAAKIVSAVQRRGANDNYVQPDLDALTHPGGLVEQLVDWIASSAERPSRWLALSAVLPFVGALAGRRFESPTGLRTNHYVAALAPSGVGKDHARTQLKRLAEEAQLLDFLGPSRFMSASALRSAVMRSPSSVAMIDEFDSFMQQINDSRAGIHNTLIRGDLKELFSSAQTLFNGSEYAVTPAARIYNPNLCIYGTGTPDAFWKSVSSLNSSEGLLPRFLLFDVTGPKPERVKPTVDVRTVPQKLVEACQSIVMAGRTGGNLRAPKLDNGETKVDATRVELDAKAAGCLEQFKLRIEDREQVLPTESAPFLNRAAEHAIKLALTVAVGIDCENPSITGPVMRWAIDLSWFSTDQMIQETRDRISDNLREGAFKRILSQIKAAGSNGITGGKVADLNRTMDKRMREEILKDLQEARRVDLRTAKGKNGGRPSARYYWVSSEAG